MRRFCRIPALISCALCVVYSCTASVGTGLPRVKTPEVVSAAVDAFIQATRDIPERGDSIAVHSVMILKNGKVIYENWYNGADAALPHELYSVSKTFTSSAVGLAISEGKLNVDDKVTSFFPDQLPDEISGNLAAMTVRDLLTMTCGHNSEPVISRGKDEEWIELFLNHPVEHTPGTYYVYNSYGTYMLSAIVQKVTGEKVLDYLDARLFQPLNIERPVWDESPQGINCGGWGLKLKTEDLAKFGQLLLQGGQWHGKQLLPAEWVREMSSYQVPSAPAGTPMEKLDELGLDKTNSDWVQGYGYQMWMCRYGAFRADGAKGQYIIVLPESDAVIVLTSDSTLYQPYIDLVWKYLHPAVS